MTAHVFPSGVTIERVDKIGLAHPRQAKYPCPQCSGVLFCGRALRPDEPVVERFHGFRCFGCGAFFRERRS